jgi:hypothetical protein
MLAQGRLADQGGRLHLPVTAVAMIGPAPSGPDPRPGRGVPIMSPQERRRRLSTTSGGANTTNPRRALRLHRYPFYGPMFVLTHQPPDPPDRTSPTSPVPSRKRSPPRWPPRAARTSRSSAPTSPASACDGDSSMRSWYKSCRSCSATASASPPRARQDRPGTGQQHARGRRHFPPVPRPQVVPAYLARRLSAGPRPGLRARRCAPSEPTRVLLAICDGSLTWLAE